MSTPDPSPEDILRIAEATVASFPPQFRGHAVMVEIVVEDLIPDEMLDEGEDPLDITGLYTGVPLTHKRDGDIPDGPDTVWLFRAPLLEELADRPGVTLQELVAHVTVHEFAHHFGWSDGQIAAIDQWWE